MNNKEEIEIISQEDIDALNRILTEKLRSEMLKINPNDEEAGIALVFQNKIKIKEIIDENFRNKIPEILERACAANLRGKDNGGPYTRLDRIFPIDDETFVSLREDVILSISSIAFQRNEEEDFSLYLDKVSSNTKECRESFYKEVHRAENEESE
jgi:hypothetical protein